MNKKKIDAVQSMRNIREKLSEKYWKHPDILEKEMEVIRKKYNIKIKPQQDRLTWLLDGQDSISDNKMHWQ